MTSLAGRAPAPCQCFRDVNRWACPRTATAEDLLCDICRIGCRRTRVDSFGGFLIAHAASPAALYQANFR
ncbi:hypothetical protein [Streptosporangium sp. NPDC006007]|uniref:hypothetical protein n=1 Tax=Streptosporangium sp. NPDC006007 TaxID=3154575 RepID=UPI0033A6D419